MFWPEDRKRLVGHVHVTSRIPVKIYPDLINMSTLDRVARVSSPFVHSVVDRGTHTVV